MGDQQSSLHVWNNEHVCVYCHIGYADSRADQACPRTPQDECPPGCGCAGCSLVRSMQAREATADE